MKPGAGWPIGIAVILGATVVANLVVMRVATNDPSFAIEPDYYKKAVAFDSTIAEERRSNALGWTATSTIVASDSAGRPTLTVRLLDAQRRPVQGATMKAVALANVRANDLVSVALTEAAPGEYAARLGARISGQWEVRVDAVRGADHFTTSTRADIP
jgi:nitrogen fixation protein FixH